VDFESINKAFCWEGKSLFVAFRVRYLHSDCFIYIDHSGQDALVRAFEDYCSVVGGVCKPLRAETLVGARFEVWNRLKMLSVISRWQNEITSDNIRRFIAELNGFPFYSLSEIEKLEAFSNGRGHAYAFELVRIGRFRIDSLANEMITGRTLIKLKPEGV
jgi:hypothetical protein